MGFNFTTPMKKSHSHEITNYRLKENLRIISVGVCELLNFSREMFHIYSVKLLVLQRKTSFNPNVDGECNFTSPCWGSVISPHPVGFALINQQR